MGVLPGSADLNGTGYPPSPADEPREASGAFGLAVPGSHAGRFPSSAAFANYDGVAPVEVASAQRARHRLRVAETVSSTSPRRWSR